MQLEKPINSDLPETVFSFSNHQCVHQIQIVQKTLMSHQRQLQPVAALAALLFPAILYSQKTANKIKTKMSIISINNVLIKN